LKKQTQFPDEQMNVTSAITKDYANPAAFGGRKNKANSRPSAGNPKQGHLTERHLKKQSQSVEA
jgi:hypothetical protein